ncbi:MAG: 5-formyltetrahydrofolate cyclo-ligase [Oscillospiraceae bacterium]|nr:5-formyltetrahydrofolate cyclo-ligase [Oscillospiraceae bacterium]
MQLAKVELRRELLQKGSEQYTSRRDVNKDKLILKNLLSLREFQESGFILTYISTENEIDTHELISNCLRLKKQAAVPRVEGSELAFYEINSFFELEKGKFGILEPVKTCKKAQINKNTLCVVPALACNENGFRLGYGKGFYDRFLCDFPGKSVVLCYSGNMIELPVEPHDVAADIVITEGGVFHRR